VPITKVNNNHIKLNGVKSTRKYKENNVHTKNHAKEKQPPKKYEENKKPKKPQVPREKDDPNHNPVIKSAKETIRHP
jgi:hypothetical protein